MADKTLFGRLRRLFSTNVIVRNVGGKKLKVADTDQIQRQMKSHLVDRYSKLQSMNLWNRIQSYHLHWISIQMNQQ